VVGFGFLRFEPLLDYPFMAKAHQQKGCPAVASIAMQTPYLSLLVTLRAKMTRFARARRSRCVQNPGANETLLGLTCRFAQTWLLGFEFPSTFMLFQKDRVGPDMKVWSKGRGLNDVSFG
jgi:hypothetical protein